ncbi:MAG TPA: DUF2851 family protein [Saprospiraceae bacterium]|nr:DUF2851 family protein [Saprospiraceae bacterium]
MKESFVQFIWRYRRIEQHQLWSTQRESIQIIDFGQYNTNAGPDFLQAKVKIGDTIWAGHVEMHVKASEWYRHRHDENPAYQNVILHVVWEADTEIERPNGQIIPCLELKPLTTPTLYQRYLKLARHPGKIPCQETLPEVPDIKIKLWLDCLLVERLDQKTSYWARALTAHKNDWEQVFYQALAHSMGLPVNKEAMEALAVRTPLRLLRKHRDQLFQIEALLFGQAGLLEDREFEEEYPQKLQREYQFLRKKYQLQAISPLEWKFSRMRPSNFPTLRIAQLALLVHQSNYLFSKIMALQSIEEAYYALEVKTSYYWKEHYRFDQRSTQRREKKLGRSTIDLMLINTIIPFIFLYGKKMGLPNYTERALHLLEQIKPENNRLIRDWAERGVPAENACQSQGLIQLYKHYCKSKRCLDCAIGTAIITGIKP